MNVLTVSIRDLHARTGHFVRQAAGMTVIVTDNGKPVAEIQPVSPRTSGLRARRPTWHDRPLLPAYARVADEPVGGTDSAQMVAEDRGR